MTNKDIVTLGNEILSRVYSNNKPNTEGYVTKTDLIKFLADAGCVYGKTKTRDFLVEALDSLIGDITGADYESDAEQEIYEETCNNDIPVPVSVAEPVDEEEYVQEEEVIDNQDSEKWSINYWWTLGAATHVINRVIAHAGRPQNNRKDVIAFHMVRSFIFEMIFGKQLTEWIDHTEIVNFSPDKTPREWELVDKFFIKFCDRYLHECIKVNDDGTKSVSKSAACINAEEMCWFYKNVSYAIIVRGYKFIYDLDWETRTMIRRDNGHIFDLSYESFKKLDKTCGLEKIR